MIAPANNLNRPPSLPDVSGAVSDFLGSNGSLARAMGGHGGFAYEHRPQQMEMAAAVSAALAEPSHLMVEAGTVGKSFAYLVPLILLAASGAKIAVSTYASACRAHPQGYSSVQEHLGINSSPVQRPGQLCVPAPLGAG